MVVQLEFIYFVIFVYIIFGLFNVFVILIDFFMFVRLMKSKDVGGEGICYFIYIDDSDGIIFVYLEMEDESESELEWEIFEVEMMVFLQYVYLCKEGINLYDKLVLKGSVNIIIC